MDKQTLEQLIAQGKLSREIAVELNTSQSTITYWLKKYKLKTNYNQNNKIINDQKICLSCNINKPIAEYHFKTKDKKYLSNKCKVCFNNDEKKRLRQIKQECLDYKGNECSNCGYNKCAAALDFHHLDPNQKDFEISRVKNKTITNIVKQELDKCIVLCANCHREVHATN